MVFHSNSNNNGHNSPTNSNLATAEPRRAIMFTLLLATLPTLAGNMDHISPFVTMFFLLMYAGINLSCFFLGVLKSPGYRPTFRYTHWSISLFGFGWCLALVALVVEDWHVTLAVLCASAVLYAYTKRRAASQNWGDVGNALRYAIATTALRALSQQTTDFHAKNWRPQVLTVVDTDDCGNPTNCQVLALAKQLKQGSGGIHLVMSVVKRPANAGGLERFETCELIAHCKALLQQHMAYHDMVDSFAQVSAATMMTSNNATTVEPSSTTFSVCQAIWSAVLHSGLGVMSPNTVLLSYPNQTSARSTEQMDDYVTTLRGIMNLNKAVILFKCASEYPPRDLASSHKRIKSSPSSSHPTTLDVWWVVHDGGLLLLLPYILSRHANFAKAQLRLFAVTTSTTENPERLKQAVLRHLAQVRISATVKVVDLSDTRIAEDMRENLDMNAISWSTSFHQDMLRTNHSTVGEVFSQEAYEVPYHAAVLDDLESGSVGLSTHHHSSSSATTPVHVRPRGWLDEEEEDDDDGLGDEGANFDSLGSSGDTFTTVRLRATAVDAEERTRTARIFNEALKKYSRHAALVVTNMPLIRSDQPGRDFLDYVDTICASIDNVLLVRGSGVEVITTYV
jgi:potassium/chloride transporter 4/5/6